MPDITLFEADLSGSKFVAPLGHYHEGGEQPPEDEGGRNWKLLIGLPVVLAGAAGGAFFLKRKLSGDGNGDDQNEVEPAGRFGFDEEFDAETDGDTEFEFERDAGDDSESRTGAVAAVVGLLFLLIVTALAKRRDEDSAADIEVDVAEPERTTAVDRDG